MADQSPRPSYLPDEQNQSPANEHIDVKAYTQKSLELAKANGWEVHKMPDNGEFEQYWFRYPPRNDKSPCLLVTSGTHGDESAGPLAAHKLMARPKDFNGCEMILFPTVNPRGLNEGKRLTPEMDDVNRDYGHLNTKEAKDQIEEAKQIGRMTVSIGLHEDWAMKDAAGNRHGGFFVYEKIDPDKINQPGFAGPAVVAMNKVIPRSYSNDVYGSAAGGGIIMPGAKMVPDPEAGPGKLKEEAGGKMLWANQGKMENERLHDDKKTDVSIIIETCSDYKPFLVPKKGANELAERPLDVTPKVPEYEKEMRTFSLDERSDCHVAGVLAIAQNACLVRPPSKSTAREGLKLEQTNPGKLKAGLDPLPDRGRAG